MLCGPPVVAVFLAAEQGLEARTAFSPCGSWALGHRLGSCGIMWISLQVEYLQAVFSNKYFSVFPF